MKEKKYAWFGGFEEDVKTKHKLNFNLIDCFTLDFILKR